MLMRRNVCRGCDSEKIETTTQLISSAGMYRVNIKSNPL